ncbi:flavodoxin family protein [Desulfovibrio sulfodismutans]|uniref:Flavodoxin family protein n=1 Tax=Desulfolutivibrio sulfodismutans TaxID=63561 RepID=A0A7K3NQY2_9BACT|nr:flavodoxin family protein [Desulfolutivibrio sulfodismutans]NDY58626.1 flavodoxin family protein [Desulfolutivibrio sulfodismutans]
MHVLAIMGSPRTGRATEQLLDQALAGVCEAAPQAQVKKIRLGESHIGPCRNCLACRDNLEAVPYAPCVQHDDMTPLLDDLARCDALIFATPVHMGHATSLAMAFLERICWTFAKPTGRVLAVRGCPVPRTAKQRTAAVIVVSGVVPPLLRRFCDEATPLVRRTLKDSLNCRTVGSLYAGAVERRGADMYAAAARRLGKAVVS